MSSPELPQRLVPPWVWPALVVVFPLLAMSGLFSTTHVFFVRDLSSMFWPRHLWFQQVYAAGRFPLWEPTSGYGYPIASDAVVQVFFPPAMLLRLLPAVVGFNLIAALPFPVAALGMFLFAKTQGSRAGAAVAAIAYSTSGLLLSTANFPNASWACALLPWVLLATESVVRRGSGAAFASLALAFGLCFLAGEPVTFTCTAVLAGSYAAAATGFRSFKAAARASSIVACAAAVGLLVSSVQLLPLADQTTRSRRAEAVRDEWSIHPISLIEAAAPKIWGNQLEPIEKQSPWLDTLHGSRGPYYLSIYSGAACLLLALLGATCWRDRHTWFWIAVAGASILFALGDFTPIYPFLREHLPLMRLFRYPAKYLAVTMFGVAMLAGVGWDALCLAAHERLARGRARLIGLIGLASGLVATVIWIRANNAPGSVAEWGAYLASALAVPEPAGAGAYLAQNLIPVGAHLAILSLVSGSLMLLCLSKPRYARASLVALFATMSLDLALTNIAINPTMDAALLEPGSWVAHVRGSPDRVFIGPSYSRGGLALSIPPGMSSMTAGALSSAAFRTYPSAWGVREAIGLDLTQLRPREYGLMARVFNGAEQADKERFLTKTGVRFFVSAVPPATPMRLVSPVADFAPTALYEAPSPYPRAALVPHAVIEPDLEAQVRTLFRRDMDPSLVVTLSNEPAAVGKEGPPEPPTAQVDAETPTSVTLSAAAAAEGGFVVLRDSYDPNWTVYVDGIRAPVERADGIFRAVRIASGKHRVVFSYEPTPLYVGAGISAMSVLLLTLLVLTPSVRSLTRRRAHM